MEVYFAVDVLGGSAVRLLHGDYAKKTVYYPDAADARGRAPPRRARAGCTWSIWTARAGTGRTTSPPCGASRPAASRLCRWAAACAAWRASRRTWTRAQAA